MESLGDYSMRDSLELLHDVLREACKSPVRPPDSPLSDSTFASDDEHENDDLSLDPLKADHEARRVQDLLKKRLAKGNGTSPGAMINSWDGAFFDKLAAEQQQLEQEKAAAELADGTTTSYTDLELLNRTSSILSSLVDKAACGTPQARQLGSAQQLIQGIDQAAREGQIPAFASVRASDATPSVQFGLNCPDWLADLGWASPADKNSRPSTAQSQHSRPRTSRGRTAERQQVPQLSAPVGLGGPRVEYCPTSNPSPSAAQRIRSLSARSKTHYSAQSQEMTSAQLQEQLSPELYGTQIDVDELDSPLLSPAGALSPVAVPAKKPSSAASLREELNNIQQTARFRPLQVPSRYDEADSYSDDGFCSDEVI